MEGMSRYSKYVDSTPSFVTYYSRDVNESMENHGLGTVKEVVGYESPNRYNRIENMPLYNVEEFRPDIMYDGLSGVTSEAEFTAVIIPDTLIPNVDDLLVFNYHETESDNNYRLFRVSNIELSNVDSNSYYRITLISTPYDKEILDSRQITDDYALIYKNIGTDEKTILLQSVLIQARELEIIYERLLESYTGNYFDSQLGSFIFYNGNVKVYSSDVHDFLQRHNDLLINSRTFMKNIKLTNYIKKNYNDEPSLLFYRYMQDIERFDEVHYLDRYELYREILYNNYQIFNSTFNILPEKYIDINGENLFRGISEMETFFSNAELFSNPLLTNNSFINIRDELISTLYSLDEDDRDIESLKDKYYSTVSDRKDVNQTLFSNIVRKYFIDNTIFDIYTEDSLPSNYLPNIVSYILNVVHNYDREELYTSDRSKILMDYIDQSIHDISRYSLNNYYYIPILLYFIKEFIDHLVNHEHNDNI